HSLRSFHRAASDFGFLYKALPIAANFTLSLLDALPILNRGRRPPPLPPLLGLSDLSAKLICCLPRHRSVSGLETALRAVSPGARSEEHTPELQSREKLVCRLLLEKKDRNH